MKFYLFLLLAFVTEFAFGITDQETTTGKADANRNQGATPDNELDRAIFVPNEHADVFEAMMVIPYDAEMEAMQHRSLSGGYGGYGYGGYGGHYNGGYLRNKFCYMKHGGGYYWRKLKVDESKVQFEDAKESTDGMSNSEPHRNLGRRCYRMGYYKCCVYRHYGPKYGGYYGTGYVW